MKKVSLEIVYEAVEERTKEIKEEIGELKQKQENDFRYFTQRIDALNQKIDSQIGQVRQEMTQMRTELRQEISQLSQRFDTVIQMLVDISKK